MKFKNSKIPTILTHNDTFKNYDFFGSANYVVTKNLNYFLNKCPHRGNRIIRPGSVKNNFQCDLHGWTWNNEGKSLNNCVDLLKKNVLKGTGNLIFINWNEPTESEWVNQLNKDSFEYSHSTYRKGSGDWRWQMEMHVDLLHVPYIHDSLNNYIDVNNLKTEYGDDWIAQHHDYGWWLFVYPFTHIEYEKGCLYISEICPNDDISGYQVYIHYLFNTSINLETKTNFIQMAEVTFDEDLKAVNDLSKNNYYKKPHKKLHKLEKDILHFYNWLEKNIEK
jgi:hypothetical protein